MQYLKQFGVILAFSLAGEILNRIIPLPIPASIYGIVLLFIALMTGIVKLEHVDKAGTFLIEIMPVMFIPAAVGLVEAWGIISRSAVAFIITTAVSTIIVIACAGLATQAVIRLQRRKQHD